MTEHSALSAIEIDGISTLENRVAEHAQ